MRGIITIQIKKNDWLPYIYTKLLEEIKAKGDSKVIIETDPAEGWIRLSKEGTMEEIDAFVKAKKDRRLMLIRPFVKLETKVIE